MGRTIHLHRSFSPLQPITLLLESVPAKDLSCLVAGYCKVFIDPQICVFPWTAESKGHRISAEEGRKAYSYSYSPSYNDLVVI